MQSQWEISHRLAPKENEGPDTTHSKSICQTLCTLSLVTKTSIFMFVKGFKNGKKKESDQTSNPHNISSLLMHRASACTFRDPPLPDACLLPMSVSFVNVFTTYIPKDPRIWRLTLWNLQRHTNLPISSPTANSSKQITHSCIPSPSCPTQSFSLA